jgi:transcriptional regulator with XRE-family HTH domain
MNATLGRMPIYYSELHKLLDKYHVYTIRQLCKDTGLSSQQGWNLWHGKVGIGRKTAHLLHRIYGIPFDQLMMLPSVPHDQRSGKREPEGGPDV